MIRSRGLLHVNLNVSDLKRSVQFYTEALGFVIVCEFRETVDPGLGPDTISQVILTVPATRTILALTQGPSFPVAAGGLNHLGLVLDSDEDVTEMVQRATAHGGTIQKEGTRERAGVSEAFAYIRDPDGYAIELSTQAVLYAMFTE